MQTNTQLYCGKGPKDLQNPKRSSQVGGTITIGCTSKKNPSAAVAKIEKRKWHDNCISNTAKQWIWTAFKFGQIYRIDIFDAIKIDCDVLCRPSINWCRLTAINFTWFYISTKSIHLHHQSIFIVLWPLPLTSSVGLCMKSVGCFFSICRTMNIASACKHTIKYTLTLKHQQHGRVPWTSIT